MSCLASSSHMMAETLSYGESANRRIFIQSLLLGVEYDRKYRVDDPIRFRTLVSGESPASLPSWLSPTLVLPSSRSAGFTAA
jgi:hypothetical protein